MNVDSAGPGSVYRCDCRGFSVGSQRPRRNLRRLYCGPLGRAYVGFSYVLCRMLVCVCCAGFHKVSLGLLALYSVC